MAWLGRKPRRSVAGHENSLREAMRSRGGVAAKPAPAPTDIEDNEPDPERSTLEWLNLNAFAPKAIQGALDRMRATLGEEAQAKAEGLPASPRKKTVESLGSSLSSALRARGGITRSSLGPESRPQEPTEPCGQEDLRTPSPSPTPLKEQRPKEEEEEDEEEDRILRSPREAGEDRILSRRKEEEDEEEDRILRSLREEGEDRILSRPKEEEEEEGRILSRPKQEEEEEEEGRILSRPKQEEEEEGQKDRILSRPKQEEDEEEDRVLSRPKEEEEEDNRVLSRPKEEEEEKDRILSRPKEEREDTAPRVPMPTPLMAATASAKRAEPPPMVQTHKPVQELPVPTKSLPAPDAYLSAQSKEVGKLKELREFWGSKNSKGFAGPGLAGSRLSKNEAQATLQRLLIAGGDFDEVRRLRKIISEQDC